jgi:hypothetical protein
MAGSWPAGFWRSAHGNSTTVGRFDRNIEAVLDLDVVPTGNEEYWDARSSKTSKNVD